MTSQSVLSNFLRLILRMKLTVYMIFQNHGVKWIFLLHGKLDTTVLRGRHFILCFELIQGCRISAHLCTLSWSWNTVVLFTTKSIKFSSQICICPANPSSPSHCCYREAMSSQLQAFEQHFWGQKSILCAHSTLVLQAHIKHVSKILASLSRRTHNYFAISTTFGRTIMLKLHFLWCTETSQTNCQSVAVNTPTLTV